jgi:hypothetical protein
LPATISAPAQAGEAVTTGGAVQGPPADGAALGMRQPALPRATDAALRLAGALGPEPRPDVRAGALPEAESRLDIPPPYRGAAPSAQPVASPSITPDMADNEVGHRLLAQTDAALARQTLLQAASLPPADHGTSATLVPGHVPADLTAPRWHFEIPFATPQGTALAQFEIARDGGGCEETETAKPVWRARFTLDVEPSGPVHALVALAGDKTMVRLWAERPATAAALRANSEQLSHALRRADLEPGEIVVGEGAPPHSASARAGHFLDRAT